MVPDRHFVKELFRLDPNLCVVWRPKAERWEIRHWFPEWVPKKPRFFIPEDIWKRRTLLIRRVCYRDEEFHDIGFHPLDDRVIYALKLSRELSVHPEKTARAVDEANKKIEDSWARDNADLAREVAQSIYHHYREPLVDLGSRSRY